MEKSWAPQSTCFGCGHSNLRGLRIQSFEEGDNLVCRWTPQPFHEASEGVLNGGIIGTILDCHSSWTALWSLKKKYGLATIPLTVASDYSVRLIRPVSLGVSRPTSSQSLLFFDPGICRDLLTCDFLQLVPRAMAGKSSRALCYNHEMMKLGVAHTLLVGSLAFVFGCSSKTPGDSKDLWSILGTLALHASNSSSQESNGFSVQTTQVAQYTYLHVGLSLPLPAATHFAAYVGPRSMRLEADGTVTGATLTDQKLGSAAQFTFSIESDRYYRLIAIAKTPNRSITHEQIVGHRNHCLGALPASSTPKEVGVCPGACARITKSGQGLFIESIHRAPGGAIYSYMDLFINDPNGNILFWDSREQFTGGADFLLSKQLETEFMCVVVDTFHVDQVPDDQFAFPGGKFETP